MALLVLAPLVAQLEVALLVIPIVHHSHYSHSQTSIRRIPHLDHHHHNGCPLHDDTHHYTQEGEALVARVVLKAAQEVEGSMVEQVELLGEQVEGA